MTPLFYWTPLLTLHLSFFNVKSGLPFFQPTIGSLEITQFQTFRYFSCFLTKCWAIRVNILANCHLIPFIQQIINFSELRGLTPFTWTTTKITRSIGFIQFNYRSFVLYDCVYLGLSAVKLLCKFSCPKWRVLLCLFDKLILLLKCQFITFGHHINKQRWQKSSQTEGSAQSFTNYSHMWSQLGRSHSRGACTCVFRCGDSGGCRLNVLWDSFVCQRLAYLWLGACHWGNIATKKRAW